MSNHNKETEARCPHCYRHYVEGTAAWALYMMRMGRKVTNPKYDPRVYHLPEGGMIHVNGVETIAGNQWIDYWCIDIPDGWEIYEEPKPEHPAINGYNRYDYIPVEGIRQPKPEPIVSCIKCDNKDKCPHYDDKLDHCIDFTTKPEPKVFETINGTLCRMVEPTPLTPESQFPCVVRLIQDDSPMGRNNDFYATSHLLAHIEIINGLDAIHFVGWQGSKTHYSRFEIIGYPVADGSAEWALWQMSQGKKVCHKSYTMKTTHCAINDKSQVVIFTTPYSVANGGDVVCHADEWLDHRQYGCGVDERTGWQLYETQPEPEPKPLLADAQVGDLCKHRNGDWSQIIDTNGTYIPGQPIRTTLKDTNGINRNFCLSGSHFTMQFGGEYDIIATEPLAPEGSAEWAWQMLILQKPVSHPAEGIWLDTYYSKDGFVRCMAKTGWQLYEEKPETAKEQFAVGDLVTDDVVIGYVSSILSQHTLIVTATDGKLYSMTTSILIRFDPSEVVIHIGCLSGTVAQCGDKEEEVFALRTKNNAAIIPVTMLDPATRSIVDSLLKAQEEK